MYYDGDVRSQRTPQKNIVWVYLQCAIWEHNRKLLVWCGEGGVDRRNEPKSGWEFRLRRRRRRRRRGRERERERERRRSV